MNTEQQIALTALIVAEKWNTHPWFEIQWDDTQNKFITEIQNDLPDGTVTTRELTTLEDAAVLWDTSEELLKNITAINGDKTRNDFTTEQRHQQRLDSIAGLINGTLSRLRHESVELPYSLITYNNWTAPTADQLPQLTELETTTGEFALSIIKLFYDTYAWEDGIKIVHQTRQFNRKTANWEPTPTPHFEVYAILEDFFWLTCYDTTLITPENAELFKQTVEEVKFRLGTDVETDDPAVDIPTVEVHSAQLFAARTEEYRSIGNSAKRRIPTELQDLYETTYSYKLGELINQ